jgi:3-dehydroquinate synthase II
MKLVWVKIIPWDKALATIALESGADAVVVDEGDEKKVRELGDIKTISSKGDIKPGKDVEFIEIKSKEDEIAAAKLAKTKLVAVKTDDWTIIPLENIIAQSEGIIAEVSSEDEARTAIGILEKGVKGVLINSNNINIIKKISSLIKEYSEKLILTTAKIKSIKKLGLGDRVCIDTCSNMSLGEGMLIGNSSSGMFLVQAESLENEYVNPRPFRVNAGGVHEYVLFPEGQTRYLSEIKAGDECLVVNSKGGTRKSIIGRAKIERRPLLMIEAEAEKGAVVSAMLQNAETVCLLDKKGKPRSVSSLKEGDEVIAFIGKLGKHFGMDIEETIKEK